MPNYEPASYPEQTFLSKAAPRSHSAEEGAIDKCQVQRCLSFLLGGGGGETTGYNCLFCFETGSHLVHDASKSLTFNF